VLAALGGGCSTGSDDREGQSSGGRSANGKGGNAGTNGGTVGSSGGTVASGGSSIGGNPDHGGASGSGGVGGSGGVREPACGEPRGVTKVDFLTRSYDLQRTNANLDEHALNVSNVNKTQFGKLFEVEVDDQVSAQVLHVSDIAVKGATRDVIYVATLNNTLYAFDANTKGDALWKLNLNGEKGRPTRNTEVGSRCGKFADFGGNIGIVGTPVIDRASNTLYVVARTVEPAAGGGEHTVQRLTAVDILTGAVKKAQVITANVAGDAPDSKDGRVEFNPQTANQRMGLALNDGVIYVGFAAYCDTGPYHGWLMAYDQDLRQLAVLNTTPKKQAKNADNPGSGAAGIWQGGSPPAFDATGNIYLSTGNGDYDGKTNFGNSALKLEAKTLAFKPDNYFTPANFGALNNTDDDLGAAGPTFLPCSNLLVLGGKEGKLYLLDSDKLGKKADADAQIPQSFQAVDAAARPGAPHHLHNGVALWRSPQGINVYVAGENDYLRAYRFDETKKKFDLPAKLVSTTLPPPGMPGGMLTISADGTKPGTGIVWMTTPRADDANRKVSPGILRAFNAETLALLWESSAVADDTYAFAKYTNPTVANGKVFVPSFSKFVSVYGLKSNKLRPNLALNKTATGSAPCTAPETPAKAVNGVNLTPSDKWCTKEANKVIQVDLGAAAMLDTIVIQHAGVLESDNFDTSDFKLELGTDGVNYPTLIDVKGNTMGVTTHKFAAVNARYIRLTITKAEQNGNALARIYEIEAYGP
jgi:hypothetical protein